MTEPAGPEGIEITQAETDSFVDKLQLWGKGLSATEQSLLNLVVAAAAAGTVDQEEVAGFQFDNSFALLRGGLAASRIFAPGVHQDGWVEIGDPWMETAGSFGQFFSR